MAKVRKQNVFNTIWAACKFVAFWIMVVVQIPIIFVLPRGKWAVGYMKIFMYILAFLCGIKVRVHGKLIKNRPLMVVSNHISVFELATFPVAFGGSFFGKNDIASYPIVGWVSKKFGVVFVDRRPSQAMNVLTQVQKQMEIATWPMYLFPEGTTTNGAYVKDFKSSLFNFVEGNDEITVQPLVMNYRFRDGTAISDDIMAEHFAYFDNAKQDMGPKCTRERSAFGQIFHIMMLGGFMTEITVLPPPPLGGMDRKQIAETLHKIISDKYMILKDKNYGKNSNNTNKG